jgi:hypothetical protein
MKRTMLLGAALLAPACQGPANALEPGQWEMTTEVLKLMGISPRHGGPVSTLTIRHCLTEEEASRPNANFLTGNDADSGCTYQDFSMVDGRVRARVQCGASDMSMTALVSGEFNSTSLETRVEGEVSRSGVDVPIESRSRARRTGDC